MTSARYCSRHGGYGFNSDCVACAANETVGSPEYVAPERAAEPPPSQEPSPPDEGERWVDTAYNRILDDRLGSAVIRAELKAAFTAGRASAKALQSLRAENEALRSKAMVAEAARMVLANDIVALADDAEVKTTLGEAVRVIRSGDEGNGDTVTDLGLHCLVTSNPCGTDTWKVGHDCRCANCQICLAHRRALEPSPPDAGDEQAWEQVNLAEYSLFDVPAGIRNIRKAFMAGRASAKPAQPLTDEPSPGSRVLGYEQGAASREGNAWERGYASGYDDREKMDHDRADVIKTENPFSEQSPMQPSDAELIEIVRAHCAQEWHPSAENNGSYAHIKSAATEALSELARRLGIK